MPDLCQNKLTICCDGGEYVTAIARQIESTPGARNIDFNKIVPMPSGLDGVGRTTRMGELYMVTEQHARTEISAAKEAAYHDAVAASGCDDWYEWRIEHWGVKWPAANTNCLECSGDYAEYTFETPWVPPEPIVHALAEQYPHAAFTLFYHEDGNQISGYINAVGAHYGQR